jgi:arylsulfatase A
MKPSYENLILLSLSVKVFAGCGSSGNKQVMPDQKNPNIIFIMADDMGYGDVGCYNSESLIPTPNMDLLASQGIRLTDAHSPAALSTPSRYGLLTGRYCWRTRLKEGVILGYDEAPLIEKGRPTIASILRESGYSTACVGKWHLGMTWETKNGYQIQNDFDIWKDNPVFTANETNIDFTKPVTGGPVELGFDYFFGTLGCTTSDPPYCFIENDSVAGIPSEISPAKYTGLPGFVTGAWCKDYPLEEVDIEFTNRAISFMERHLESKPDEPFFVYLALSSPHNPFLPPAFTSGKSKEGPRGDLVMVADWSVGMIMEFLKLRGLEENTLVILTSDNGAMRGANGHLSSGQFRGYKGNIWEGGHRVPFIARWPGRIEPGSISNELISLTDMFASFSALVSHPVADNEGEDSYNVLPVILGDKASEYIDYPRILHSSDGAYAVRLGDWKLIDGTSGSGSGALIFLADSLRLTGQLYNLAEDPGEKNNLWINNPSLRDSLSTIIDRAKDLPGTSQLIFKTIRSDKSYFVY